jgi:hypothetical protein
VIFFNFHVFSNLVSLFNPHFSLDGLALANVIMGEQYLSVEVALFNRAVVN